MIGDSIVIAFTLLLGRFIGIEASYQWAKRTHSGFRYPVGVGLRILFRGGGPLLMFVAYKLSQQAASPFDWAVVCAVTLLGFGCVLGEPGEIATTQKGILQKTLLGLKRRIIPWPGAEARHVAALREVVVIGQDGTAITHSQYHVGQEQFLRELQNHRIAVQG